MAKEKTKKANNSNDRVPDKPYKMDSYEAFIKLVESGVPVNSWKSIAQDLGVAEETLVNWKKTERYRVARARVLTHAIKAMKQTGELDWRMWDRYVKLLGIDAIDQHDLTSGGEKINNTQVIFIDGTEGSEDI